MHKKNKPFQTMPSMVDLTKILRNDHERSQYVNGFREWCYIKGHSVYIDQHGYEMADLFYWNQYIELFKNSAKQSLSQEAPNTD